MISEIDCAPKIGCFSLYEERESMSPCAWNGREVRPLNNATCSVFTTSNLMENGKVSVMLCKGRSNNQDKDTSGNKEAQEHFDRAKEALGEALMHSAGAGLSIEVPPVAVYEAYKAVQSWQEMASEYKQGCDIRDSENKENNSD